MNFEDTTIGKIYLIEFKGQQIEVYRSKLHPNFINANNCTTTYPKESCRIIKEVK